MSDPAAPPPPQGLLDRLRPWALPGALVVFVTTVVLHRIARTPIVPYGTDGAHHLEHSARLEVLWQWRNGGDLSWLEWIRNIDGEFPPLLHVLTLLPGAVTGHAVENILWTGLVWLFLLAAALGATAWLTVGSRRAAVAAACGVLLVPALPAVATRYYYDLPLTALAWFAVVVVLFSWNGSRSRALLGGVAVGALVTASAMIKWPGVIVAPTLVLAAFASPRHSGAGPRWAAAPRLLGLGCAVLTAAVSTYFVTVLLGPTSSLRIALDEMFPGLGGTLLSGGWPRLASAVSFVSAGEAGLGRPFEAAALWFYPMTLVTGFLSPLLALASLPLLVSWWRRGRPAWRLLALAFGGTWLFLYFVIPPFDERFFLPAVPALVLVLALGWDSLPEPWRRRSAVGLVGLAALVSLEFHYGPSPVLASEVALLAPEDYGRLELRGVFLSDSWDRRGWSHFDSEDPERDFRAGARDRLWALVSSCALELEVLTEAPSEVHPLGDFHWLEYHFLLEKLGEAPKPEVPEDCRSAKFLLGGLDRPVRVEKSLLLEAAVLHLMESEAPLPVRALGCPAELELILERKLSSEPLLSPLELLQAEASGSGCVRIERQSSDQRR